MKVAIDTKGYVIGMGENSVQAAMNPAKAEGYGSTEDAAHMWLAYNRGATFDCTTEVQQAVEAGNKVRVRITPMNVATLA